MLALHSCQASARNVINALHKVFHPSRIDKPAVKPYELLMFCKPAYGLSEAPRLWHLRAKELFVELGYIELELCRATFIMKEGSEVVAILCLCVDGGLFVTAPERMKKAQQAISSKFNIMEWPSMKNKTNHFPWRIHLTAGQHFQDSIDDMTEYMERVQPAEIKTKKEGILEGHQLSACRRLAMQLRWPAHLVMPEFLYRV